MRDMIPHNDRSIRNIPVPTNHRRSAPPVTMDMDEEDTTPVRTPRRKRGGGKRKVFIMAAVAVVVLGALLAILLSTSLAGATVTVFPRKETVTAPASLVARINAPVGSLSYQTMTITRGATTTVPASGTKQVSRQASGVMTIYNTFDSKTQRLIANTRFEAPDGKIYRIHDSVVVPGMSGSNPGTITATVYADSPGAEYNRGETRFTIPGFKGDPRYAKFYAETKAITNGFVGTEPSVAAADLSAAQAALQQNLQAAVQAEVAAQVPDGYLPLISTLRVSYSNITQTPGAGSSANLSQTAQATVAIVRANDLAAAVAKQTLPTYDGAAIAFEDVSQISITTPSATAATGDALTLTLSGRPTLVWQFDPGTLLEALAGKDKGAFQEVIQSFEPAIMRAEASIRPFWKSAFPSNTEKIQIETGVE